MVLPRCGTAKEPVPSRSSTARFLTVTLQRCASASEHCARRRVAGSVALARLHLPTQRAALLSQPAPKCSHQPCMELAVLCGVVCHQLPREDMPRAQLHCWGGGAVRVCGREDADPQCHSGDHSGEPPGWCCASALRNHKLELLRSCFCFCMSYFLDSLCHSSPCPFPPPLPSLPHSSSFLLFLFILFLLPVASSRPRGRSCGILRPVGSLPRSLWELTWQPAGSGGPSRYMQPRAEGRGGHGREQSQPAPRDLPTQPGAGQHVSAGCARGSALLPCPGAALGPHMPRVLPRLQHMLPCPCGA